MADGILAANPERRFYVYILYRPDRRPCYVGKGKDNRWKAHFSRTHNRHLHNIIAKYGDGIQVNQIFVDNEADAYELEALLIGEIGRHPNGPLANDSDGGKGGSAGRKMPAEEIQRRTKILEERGVIERLRKWNNIRGPISEEIKTKMSAAHKKRWARRKVLGIKSDYRPSAEVIAKRGAGIKRSYDEGRHKRPTKFPKLSAEAIQGAIENRRGTKWSEESRRRLSAALKGRKWSQEAIEARRQGLNARWATIPGARQAHSERMRRWWSDRKIAAQSKSLELFEDKDGT